MAVEDIKKQVLAWIAEHSDPASSHKRLSSDELRSGAETILKDAREKGHMSSAEYQSCMVLVVRQTRPEVEQQRIDSKKFAEENKETIDKMALELWRQTADSHSDPPIREKAKRAIEKHETSQEHPFNEQKILTDPATSEWLKAAINSLSQRDPAEAMGDVEVLLKIQKSRVEENTADI